MRERLKAKMNVAFTERIADDITEDRSAGTGIRCGCNSRVRRERFAEVTRASQKAEITTEKVRGIAHENSDKHKHGMPSRAWTQIGTGYMTRR